jgi:hypothetical protein
VNIFKWVSKAISPKKRIAAIVDAVIDRVNERYELRGNAWLEGDRFKFSVQLVDSKPNAPKVDLDEVAKAE